MFWPVLYPGLSPSKFSNSWLEGFKLRHSIKKYKRHGEAADVNTDANNEAIYNLQVWTSLYPLSDIYSMDESGLYWKMVPDVSLSTQQLSGNKKAKARVSIAVLANGGGTERPRMWVIGSAKQPRCFKSINIEHTGIKWQANKKVWITTTIMRDWLGWFWSYLKACKPGKKVLLLMDNHSSHVKAVEDLKEGSVILQDIEIIFLPPNTTSRYQPVIKV